MEIEKELQSITKEKYGAEYNYHILEIYKQYVESIEKTSDRRQSSNNFFLSVNTALVALFGYTKIIQTSSTDSLRHYWVIGVVGILLCFVWCRLIISYKGLNRGKFKILHHIEKLLPIRPFDAEWTALGKGENRKLYWPFSHLEFCIPIIFSLLYVFIIISFFFL